MRERSNAPTMKDVAREAGVALGTVSKVFNGLPVGESYRKRVEAAAEKLGYQVNVYARGLRASKTNVIAVILPGTIHPFFGALAEHLGKELSRRGCRMMLEQTGYNVQGEQNAIQMVWQNKVDGIIGLTYSPDLEVPENIPFVSFDRCLGPNIPCISSDNFGGGQMAAQKLAELGCKHLLFLRRGTTVKGEVDKRQLGFETACQSLGLPYDCLNCRDEEEMVPFAAFLDDHIHKGRLDYDGIFCNTDLLAARIWSMLLERGISVPEQVQIIGFDGLQLFGFDWYYCSTMVQPVEKLAATAVNVLLSEDRENLPSMIYLPVTYAPAGSTKDGVSPWPVTISSGNTATSSRKKK